MSMNLRISKLDSRYKRRIVKLLYMNGCNREDVDLIVKEGRLKDIADYVDFDEIFG